MKQVFRKEQIQTNDAILYLFAKIPLKDFQQGIWKARQEGRLIILKGLFSPPEEESTHVKVLAHERY